MGLKGITLQEAEGQEEEVLTSGRGGVALPCWSCKRRDQNTAPARQGARGEML